MEDLRYNTLLQILDKLNHDAPTEFKSYHPTEFKSYHPTEEKESIAQDRNHLFIYS